MNNHDEQPLKEMFDKMLDKKQYIMAEGYLEMVRATFSQYEKWNDILNCHDVANKSGYDLEMEIR